MGATSYIIFVLLSLISLTPLSFSERCHPNDKKALLKIKTELNNPDDIISWVPKTDCCTEWIGVLCDAKTNRIDELFIFRSGLNLPIPPSVGDLPYLKNLALHLTNVTGQIPLAISKLTNLQSLDLRYNLLTGPIPAFLGNLKKLRFIGLTSNSLTGSIPASLSQLTGLTALALDRNKLTGPIPRELGSSNFNILELSRNRLEGDLSLLFGKNKSLETADFSRNLFEFDFSKVSAFPNTLMSLDLSRNKIYGSIPKGLTKINGLNSLDVSYNRLCGKIPAGGTGRLQQLRPQEFSNNKCLCGSPLPKCK